VHFVVKQLSERHFQRAIGLLQGSDRLIKSVEPEAHQSQASHFGSACAKACDDMHDTRSAGHWLHVETIAAAGWVAS
jgi:hypothetical protein